MKLKKLQSLIILLTLTSNCVFAQNWTKISEDKIQSENVLSRPNKPNYYSILKLDIPDINSKLENIPDRNLNDPNQNGVKLKFPTPNGEFIEFNVTKVNDFENELAEKYPNFKSYIGYALNKKHTTISFTINALGLNGIIQSPEFSTIYIDSYSKDLKNCIVYYRKDLERVKEFTCHTTDTELAPVISPRDSYNQKRNSGGILRQYKFAMACTIEYAAFHINRANGQNLTTAQKKAIVLSAMQTTINRVNSLYERDMAIRFNLVAQNDRIIFIDTDEFSNDNPRSLINQSQTVINREIGFSNYDIGHTVSTGGGGLAQLYSPCSSNKARGITGSSQPINDPYDIDYVAHEVGHQFGATHTFNNSCDENITTTSSYEPGSGSTIMAYAGICAPNVTSNSDDHFHNYSISQMSSFVSTNGTCSSNTTLANTAPNIQNLENYTIPRGTAFKLTANATDNQNDALTYVWEQMNLEVSVQPPTENAINGPNYKSVRPSTSATRYFPEFNSVLNGNLTPTWEVTPNVARTLNFAVTVRDNNTFVGQTKIAYNTVTVANTGPFTITSPNVENTIWDINSQQTITWNVAGTTANNINVSTVKILLSTDNGATFTTLLASTPNDGSETITVPNVNSTNARIMIEANGNIFYAVSKKIVIGYTANTEQVCRDYIRNFNFNLVSANTTYVVEIPVTENITISNTKLYTNITTTRANDLNIFLKKPNETNDYSNMVFGNYNCSSYPSNVIATFENFTSEQNCNNVNNESTIRPTQNFNTNGINAQGNWQILYLKTANRSAILKSVKLTLCGTLTTYTLSNKDNEIKNFTLFPNPNNGNFTIDFNPKSTIINLDVFDIRGRKVYEKNVTTNGQTSHNLNLSNVAKGVYIVKVTDGDLTKSQKVIIQ